MPYNRKTSQENVVYFKFLSISKLSYTNLFYKYKANSMNELYNTSKNTDTLFYDRFR